MLLPSDIAARAPAMSGPATLGASVAGGTCKPDFLDNWWWTIPGIFIGWTFASYLEDAAGAHRRIRSRGR